MSATADRYWPAVLAATVILTAELIGGIVWYLTTMLPLEIYVGHSPWSMLAFNNLCAAISLAFTIAGACVWCFQAHARMRRRERAAAGDPAAVPLAYITSNHEDTPNVGTEPLALAWRTLGPRGGFWRVFSFSYLALMILVPLVDAGLIALSLRLGLNFIVVGICGTVAMIGVYVAVLARVLGHPVPTTRVERLVATSDGLLWQRTGARDKEIPWYDARLFEIWRPDGSYGQHGLGYILYGRKNSIAWRMRSIRDAAPEGMTADKLEKRQFLLIDLIAAKTRLALRTFVTSLQRDWDTGDL